MAAHEVWTGRLSYGSVETRYCTHFVCAKKKRTRGLNLLSEKQMPSLGGVRQNNFTPVHRMIRAQTTPNKLYGDDPTIMDSFRAYIYRPEAFTGAACALAAFTVMRKTCTPLDAKSMAAGASQSTCIKCTIMLSEKKKGEMTCGKSKSHVEVVLSRIYG